MYRNIAMRATENIERRIEYGDLSHLEDTALIRAALYEMESLERTKAAYDKAVDRAEAIIRRLQETEGNEGIITEIGKIFAK